MAFGQTPRKNLGQQRHAALWMKQYNWALQKGFKTMDVAYLCFIHSFSFLYSKNTDVILHFQWFQNPFPVIWRTSESESLETVGPELEAMDRGFELARPLRTETRSPAPRHGSGSFVKDFSRNCVSLFWLFKELPFFGRIAILYLFTTLFAWVSVFPSSSLHVFLFRPSRIQEFFKWSAGRFCPRWMGRFCPQWMGRFCPPMKFDDN